MTSGTVQFMSKSLGRHVTYTVFLPDAATAGPGPYKVLLQLHGATDDHTAWMNRSNLFRHVQGLPLVVIMPDGALSFWINFSNRERYADMLNVDLREHVRAVYNVDDSKWAIGGLSMGGYGALHNGLSHPDKYCSVWAHSSACFSEADLKDRLRERPFAVPEDTAYADLFRVAAQADRSELGVISFDCGTEDFLIEHNRRFHAHLNGLGLPHSYFEHPGAHEWDYWDVHVKEALEQHAKALGIKKG